MKGKLLFDISHLKFEVPCSVNVNNSLFTLTNNNEVRETFFTEALKKAYGEESTKYSPNTVFAHSEIEILNTDGVLTDEIRMYFEEQMAERMQYLESLLTFLWFVKDNSVGLYTTIGNIPERNISNKLSKSISFWNKEGRKVNTIFNPQELQLAADYTIKYHEIVKGEVKSVKDMILPDYELDQYGKPFRTFLMRSPNTFNYNAQNCIERAFTFLMMARGQSTILYRIAYYMPILESLFTTSSVEITTKMSYRVAFYIGQTPEECSDIFNLIYDSYNIRSKFLYGQEFDSDKHIEMKLLLDTSEKLDDIIRKILVKVITKDSEIFTKYTRKQRGKYLDSLVFSLGFKL